MSWQNKGVGTYLNVDRFISAAGGAFRGAGVSQFHGFAVQWSHLSRYIPQESPPSATIYLSLIK